jgi:imidazolonepropionase-like amidohydrolase
MRDVRRLFMMFLMLLSGCTKTEQAVKDARAGAQASPAPAIALVGAAVVHPETATVEHDVTVLLQGDRISAVGPSASVKLPANTQVIDVHGKWLVPGYVDTHIHFFQSGTYFTRPDVVDFTSVRAYADEVKINRERLAHTFATWLATGVTAVADMGGPFWNFDVRALAERNAAAPDVFVTGPLISTVDRKQLATAGDPPIIQVSNEEEAEALALKEIDRKPDFLKVWFVHHEGDDLGAKQRIIRRVADVAHSHGLRLAVHATQLENAKIALRAGADMLVHSVDDVEIDDELVALARAAHATYTPTLYQKDGYAKALTATWSPTPEEQRLCEPAVLADLDMIKSIAPKNLPEVMQSRMEGPRAPELSPVRAHNLMRMWREGFLVTVGTDAGNIGTVHGPSYYRELALMVKAGLTPAEVLRAATTNGARFLRQQGATDDVRPGVLANLVVLSADPLTDVKNMSAVDRVIKRGKVFTPSALVAH